MQRTKTAFLGCVFSAAAFLSPAAHADAVLFLHFGPLADSYSNYGNAIAGFIDGAPNSTVTIGSMSSASWSAADLSAYDQIWVYDLNQSQTVSATQASNIANIAAWYNQRNAANVGNNLILDGRILSSAFSVQETGLIQSFYNNMAAAGGGLFLGTDHCNDWCTGINEINEAIDVNPFTGFYGANLAILDTASPLAQGVPCTVSSGGNCYIYSNTTTGFAAAGMQANGQFLTPLAYNTTDPSAVLTQAYQLTAISSSFGSQTFGTLPEPGSLALVGAGLLGFAVSRRRTSQSSV
jgi:hypothetical protein